MRVFRCLDNSYLYVRDCLNYSDCCAIHNYMLRCRSTARCASLRWDFTYNQFYLEF